MAEWVAIVALIAATALIMTQIVAREIFVAGLSWADELARYAGLTVIFMGVPTLLVRDEHVKVDMFLNMMPARPRRFFNITNDALMVAFAAMFLIAGWQFMQRAARFSTPALGMPNLIFYMPAAIGMTLLFFVAIDRAVAALGSGAKDEANTP
jgi:TRAP-type C4-dicarboxylate transport system permease small subunit